MSTTIQAVDTTNVPSETVVIKQKELYSKTTTFEEKETESQEEEQQQIQSKPPQSKPSQEQQQQTEEQEQNEENAEDAEEENYIKANEMTEAAMINSQFFETELLSAFENIEAIAKIDRQRILTCVVQDYVKNVGEEPSPDMVAEALQTFEIDDGADEDSQSESDSEEAGDEEEVDQEDINQNDDEKAEVEQDYNSENDIEVESEEEAEIEINADVFEKEFAEALKNVISLGKTHQEIFVNNICDTFVELNGNEPSVNDISAIFGRMKQTFSEEARETFMEENEVRSGDESGEEDSDSDSDYAPNDEDSQAISTDQQIDIEEEDAVNAFDEDYSPEKDTFDYSQDLEDDIEFESDQSSDNNNDENDAEMINIE